MQTALVTGATGFIGGRLVDHLLVQNVAVGSLVRPASATKATPGGGLEIIAAELTDGPAIERAVQGVDVVFHLAGVTKAINRRSMWEVNESGTRMISRACAAADRPPTLIVLSSLAASGPNVPTGRSAAGDTHRARVETDRPAPVSQYGHSKLAGEAAARQFCHDVPTSILRPPIVLGPGDRAGLEWFKFIRTARCFAIMGRGDQLYSIVAVDDLIAAMILIARCGDRCVGDAEDPAGTFFVADPEVLTFKTLNRRIAASVDRPRAWAVPLPAAAVPAAGIFNDVVGRIVGKPPILGRDKAREATAAGWACDPSRLMDQTGWRPATSLDARLAQTVAWYREHHWL